MSSHLDDKEQRDRVDLDAWLAERCVVHGFAAWGIADAAPIGRPDALREWLAAGKHGEMAWLAEHESMLCDPATLVPGAKSIICVADRYADGRRDLRGRSGWGRIARYARGADYHRVVRARLEALRDALRDDWPAHRFRACVDTAPLMEREHAARAGLGAIGKHTLLIAPGLGSWLMLGSIVTTMPLTPTASARRSTAEKRSQPDPCAHCTRCIDACPTDAITPWSVDATRCIAYLTIEHRGPIPDEHHEAIGDWLFGCDICQEVCPHNQPTRRSRAAGVHPEYAARRDGFDAMSVLDWDESEWSAQFDGTALTRARLDAMRRNAIIVAANTVPAHAADALRERLAAIAADGDENEIVRETAILTLARMRARG